MSSAINDTSITNSGLQATSASQLSNDSESFGNSAKSLGNWVDWFPGLKNIGSTSKNSANSLRYEFDDRGDLPSWMDWISGYNRQRDNQLYQQWLSDTAIQRRVADAKLAGVNPLFAIGSGSGADSSINYSQDTSNSTGAKAMGGIGKKLMSLALLLFLFS